MNNEGKRVNKTDNSKPGFIKHLKEYKEFIAILVFFVGGFMWVYGYFATKKQVDVVKCISDYNITLLESRMQKKFLFDELTQKGMELEKLLSQINIAKEKNKKSALSEKEKVIRLKELMLLMRKSLVETHVKYDEAYNYLKANKCQNP